MKCNWKYAVTTFLGISLAGSLTSLAKAANQSGIVSAEIMDSAIEISGETRAIASELIETGRQRYTSGQFSGAVEAWQSAVDAARAQDAKTTQMMALSYLSLAYQALGHWDLAEAAVEQSVELLDELSENSKLLESRGEQNAGQGPHPMLQAQVLNTQASLVYHLGQAELALDLWQQSEAFYQQAEDTSGVLGSQLNQAQALQSLGYYRRSRQQLEEITQQLRTLPDSALKANGLRTLGEALRVLGDLEGSRAALFESANIAVAINATNELSATYLSLGKAAADWGDTAAAIAMFERARQAAQNPTDTLKADLERLRFYVNSGDIEQSTSTANNIATQLEKLPPSRTAVYATVNLSASLAREEALGRSLPITQHNQLLAKAVRAARALNDPQAEAHALNQWGALYTLTEQWSEALTLTEQSLVIARSIQADDIASQSAWQLGRIHKQQNNTAEAITAYSEAVDSLQSLRSDLVAIDPAVQFSFRENTEPIYRELVSLLLETGSSGNKRAAQPSQKNLAQAREVIEALQLAELDDFFKEACIDIASQQIDQVDTQATIVYPIILPDRLAVITSSPGQPLAYHAAPVSADTVEDTLRELLGVIHPAADNARRLALSQQVYDWLIRPAEERQMTTTTETVVFVLDGLLRNVPMAALHDGEQYLIEKYAVALSAGLQLMSAQSLDEIDANAIAGGISEARNGLSALPAVETELADIDKLIPTDTLLNEAFTSTALASNIKNSTANIVHLATHGQFSSRLEDTFLSTWEGRLNVQELSEILQSRGQLDPIELLVLSACDTALGDDRAVLGLAGLAVKSGARSTVATLWPVKDQAAAMLMQALYESISTSEITKAEALRQAQLTLIADPSYSDPFFWSAYTLVGNWR
ncbi:tetratricopeptide repeat domain protein [Synechococcus sp. PCC 7335]|uniref:CHAT domain-containing protein n=1 Tax=Synechococcus sp. (strain ATCC 29403 / PCC 7335) TaxID=91464 RepID=UPI00017EE48D|nr:CHAT domain-containing protein [Synechococcus sp. PCC 7335]EDX83602.1 tetratricopeptide repeat domain protein [Synechococcus sp. PCC 7335]